MFDLSGYPRLLKALSYWYRIQASMLRRNPGTLKATNHRARFYEDAWREAAHSLDANVQSLGRGICEIRRSHKCVRVSKNCTPIDDPVTLEIAGDKALVYRLLAQCVVPIPRYAEFTLSSIREAIEFMEAVAGDCVVKPTRDTGGGAGVTTGIRTRHSLALAAAAAAAHGTDLLIEQQIEGDTYRLLYLDGVLLDAVVRKAPSVVGDGESTVAKLVAKANAERLNRGVELGQVLITPDLDMRRTLAEHGLRLRSIPRPGQVVRLKTVANENSSLENEAASHLLCDSIVESGSIAAWAVGVRFAGVDVVTRDPGVPLADSGGVILELNTTPGYYYHYHRRGGRCPVATAILKTLLCEEQVERESNTVWETAQPSGSKEYDHENVHV